MNPEASVGRNLHLLLASTVLENNFPSTSYKILYQLHIYQSVNCQDHRFNFLKLKVHTILGNILIYRLIYDV